MKSSFRAWTLNYYASQDNSAKFEDYGKMPSKFWRNQPRNPYLDKLSIKGEGRIKTFLDIHALKFTTYKLFFRKILEIMPNKKELNQDRQWFQIQVTKDPKEVGGKQNSQADAKRKFRKSGGQQAHWVANTESRGRKENSQMETSRKPKGKKNW